MSTIRQLADEARRSFERQTLGEREIWVMRPGSPWWVTGLVHKAHGDMTPDDWRYEFVVEALGRIVDSGSEAWDGDMTTDEFYDALSDLSSETEADIYTHELISWLGSRNDRYSFVDEAVEEYGHGDGIINDIMAGQVREKNEVLELVVRALAAGPEALEEEFPPLKSDPFVSERKRWRPKK